MVRTVETWHRGPVAFRITRDSTGLSGYMDVDGDPFPKWDGTHAWLASIAGASFAIETEGGWQWQIHDDLMGGELSMEEMKRRLFVVWDGLKVMEPWQEVLAKTFRNDRKKFDKYLRWIGSILESYAAKRLALRGAVPGTGNSLVRMQFLGVV